MRWTDARSWECMIDWSSRLHDGYYPSSSPTPTPKMCGCKDPERECIVLAIAHKIGKGYQCTLPHYVPGRFAPKECPNRIPSWKDSQNPQTSKDNKTKGVKEGKSQDILEWTQQTLKRIRDGKDNQLRVTAAMFLDDLDIPSQLSDLQRLGELMLARFQAEKPWKEK